MSQTLDQAFNWTSASNPLNRLTNVYEPVQPYILVEFSRHLDCTVFVDIGANIGFCSVLMGTELGASTVYAFEPMPQAHKELQENLSLNELSDRASTRNIALSSQVGDAEMLVVSDLSGANAIRDTSHRKEDSFSRSERVRISTLDDELPLAGKKISLKVDVEGHEVEVLIGGKRFLRNNSCIIQVESLHDGSRHEKLVDLLTSFGYQKVIHIGSDYYFSNVDVSASSVASCVSSALSRFVKDMKKPPLVRSDRVIRQRIFPSVTIELSSALSRRIRKILRKT